MRRAAALLSGLLLAVGVASCEYVDAGDPTPTAGGSAERSNTPKGPLPTKAPEVVALEASNFAELERILGAAPGAVVLEDSGTVGGPAMGFNKNSRVKAAGAYAVTAACVGAPDAQLSLSQDSRTGGTPLEVTFSCSQASTRVVQLKPGYVSVRVMRFDPGSLPGTGAVAGVRIAAAAG
jgi:hypothetical protein